MISQMLIALRTIFFIFIQPMASNREFLRQKSYFGMLAISMLLQSDFILTRSIYSFTLWKTRKTLYPMWDHSFAFMTDNSKFLWY